jgi:DNA-directed RNA polymerase specialized sigma24 family protein
MTPTELNAIQKIASTTARYFVNKLPWAQSHAPDLLQEAILALLQAAATFAPAKGAWEPYARQAADQACRRFLHRNRTVVVPPRPERGGTPLDVVALDAPQEDVLSHPDAFDPVAALEAERLARRVRAVVVPLDTPQRVGVAVLLREELPRDTARERKLPVQEVYAARNKLFTQAKRSKALAQLWREAAA